MPPTQKRRSHKFQTWELKAAAISPDYRQALEEAYHGSPVLLIGTVLECLQQGRAVSGMLLMGGTRVHHVLEADGKEHAVPLDRVIDYSSLILDPTRPRHAIMTDLHAVEAEREALKAAIDLETLWEVTSDEAHPWTLDALATLYFHGESGRHGKAALFRALLDGGYFRRDGLTFTPQPRKLVEAHRVQQRHRLAAEAGLQEVGAWLRRAVDGSVTPPPAGAAHALAMIAGRVLFGPAHPDARTVERIAAAGHLSTREALIDALTAVGHWSWDENLDLLRVGTPVAFSAEAVAEAKAARARRSVREAPALTGRKVFAAADDAGEHAFSLRADRYGCTVGIHLASPALLMRPGDALEHATEERAVTLALPDRTIPLLPPALTDRVLLTRDAYRPCLTLFVRFAPDGTLERFHFAVRRVQVTHVLPEDDLRDVTLRKLHELARQLRDERAARGAVILAEPEIDVRVDAGSIAITRHAANAPGRLIARELVLLANTLAGRYCRDAALPALYRAEEAPSAVLGDPEHFDPVAAYRQKRLMPRATLQTTPAPHAGVGAAAYVPITGACRRYTDLLMHRQLLGCLADGQAPLTPEALEHALLRTATARLAQQEITANAQRYWLLRDLEGRVGEALPAVVLERFTAGALVELTATRLHVYCPAAALPPGAPLTVRVEHVSAPADVVRVRVSP